MVFWMIAFLSASCGQTISSGRPTSPPSHPLSAPAAVARTGTPAWRPGGDPRRPKGMDFGANMAFAEKAKRHSTSLHRVVGDLGES